MSFDKLSDGSNAHFLPPGIPECVAFLRQFQQWRRGDEKLSMPSPTEIGVHLDFAIEVMDAMAGHDHPMIITATARLEAELKCKEQRNAMLDLRNQLEASKGENKKLNTVAFQAQNAAIDLANQLAAAQLREKKLRDALIITHDLYSNAASGYGFARPENPHNFSPDFECCSQDEIKAHSKACEDYDAGRKISNDSWGIGAYCDEYSPALKALSTPTDTSQLDAYVAEMVKDAKAEVLDQVRHFKRVREQRDLAVDAIETYLQDNDTEGFGCACTPDHKCGPCNAYSRQVPLVKALSAIKESEGK